MITIIIPVFNKELQIGMCLSSVINQSYRDLEIIVINDGSTDNSDLIIGKFLFDKRITYINQANMGVSFCRNYGINIARGDYIFFLDGDDYLDGEAIKTLTGFIDPHLPDVIVGNFIYDNNQLLVKNHNFDVGYFFEKREILSSQMKFRMFFSYGRPFSSACNKLYKKTFLIKNNLQFEDRVFSEDRLFNLFLYAHVPKILICNEFTYYVSIVEGSRSRNTFTDYYNQIFSLSKKFYNYIQMKQLIEINYDLIFYTFTNDLIKYHNYIWKNCRKFKCLQLKKSVLLVNSDYELKPIIVLCSKYINQIKLKNNYRLIFLKIYFQSLRFPSCLCFVFGVYLGFIQAKENLRRYFRFRQKVN